MNCFHVKLGKDSSQIERKAKLMLGMGGNKRVVHGHKQLEAASPLLSNSMLCFSPVFLQFSLFLCFRAWWKLQCIISHFTNKIKMILLVVATWHSCWTTQVFLTCTNGWDTLCPYKRVRCCDAYKWGRYVVSTHHLSTRSFLAIFASRALVWEVEIKECSRCSMFLLAARWQDVQHRVLRIDWVISWAKYVAKV